MPQDPMTSTDAATFSWSTNFLSETTVNGEQETEERCLIILNQPFSEPLLSRLWKSCAWRCCADGGANRLYDLWGDDEEKRGSHLPNLIKGDLDSLRPGVRRYYEGKGVPVVKDGSQYATDLQKCVDAIQEREQARSSEMSEIILLGGLSGRLDQTIHTLSYLHKLRKTKRRVFAVTDDNVGWVLDSGEHNIHIDHHLMGQTCGLLPVGIDETILSTKGLKWNLTDHPSSFDGMVSTSNHLVPEEEVVWVKTTKPIWWTAELKSSGLTSPV